MADLKEESVAKKLTLEELLARRDNVTRDLRHAQHRARQNPENTQYARLAEHLRRELKALAGEILGRKARKT